MIETLESFQGIETFEKKDGYSIPIIYMIYSIIISLNYSNIL